ncbi:hypothetical protein [Halomontanus rarus]|uniref:hypothetical protein n=1 Tax=Halomontanus rarus TaxID=3034020 RepID=UPI001A996216
MKRREIISMTGTGAIVGLGGCTSVFSEDRTVELLMVGVINWTDVKTTVQVRVDLDGEAVHEDMVELRPEDDGHILDCAWPSEPGHFVVSARLENDEEWEERDVTDPDADCAGAYVMIEDTIGSSPAISMPISRACERHADHCE